MVDINVQGTIHYETTEPYKLELTRGQKGAYGWVITVHGERIPHTLYDLKQIDDELRATYLAPTPETPTEA